MTKWLIHALNYDLIIIHGWSPFPYIQSYIPPIWNTRRSVVSQKNEPVWSMCGNFPGWNSTNWFWCPITFSLAEILPAEPLSYSWHINVLQAVILLNWQLPHSWYIKFSLGFRNHLKDRTFFSLAFPTIKLFSWSPPTI